jgi:hypothetical protein
MEGPFLFKLLTGWRPAKGKTKAGHAFWEGVRADLDAIARRSFGRVRDPGTEGVAWTDLAERHVTLRLDGHAQWRAALDGSGETPSQVEALAAFHRLLRKHRLDCGRLEDGGYVLSRRG